MFVTKEKINESISPITANTLSFLVDSLRGRSEEDRKAVEALLDKYDIDDIGDLEQRSMREAGAALIEILTKDSNNASANADDDCFISKLEKLTYAHLVVIRTLEDISKALYQLSILDNCSSENAPISVIHNECYKALDALVPVLTQIDEACEAIFDVYEYTKLMNRGGKHHD